MSLSTSETKARSEKGGERRLLCPACRHLNVLDREACSQCGERLYGTCPHCGAKTDRVHSRCRACGKALPSSAFASFKGEARRVWGKVRLEQVVLLVVAILLGFMAVIYFTQMSPSGGE